MEDGKIKALQRMIDASERVVFFGGAGVSTESGIPDFRTESPAGEGVYNQPFAWPPEQMLSHSFYQSHPLEFFDFYRKKMLFLDAAPNAAHHKLAELEKAGRLSAVITQNIDGLHSAAGSRKVIELHGSVHRNHCQSCGKRYDAAHMLHSTGVPTCECGGTIKPDVVLYEEPLDQAAITAAVRAIQNADMLIIGGTSLVVYPAAGLVDHYTGGRLAVINRQPTQRDGSADLLIEGSIGQVLGAVEVHPGPPA